MQFTALFVSLFLALTVAAAPFEPKDSGLPDLENSFNNIGNGENNPSVGDHNGNNNGNNNGNGNTIGSNNQLTGDNEFLNDFFNVNLGATSQQISKEVVAAVKSLTLSCSSSDEGELSCTWKS
ncbi:hypothetical protein F5Y03DRAFT_343389 [Xylaria venustula]|nr:hypothetical protein F5Y03DRAFT_343389 [Xylaria venustula]